MRETFTVHSSRSVWACFEVKKIHAIDFILIFSVLWYCCQLLKLNCFRLYAKIVSLITEIIDIVYGFIHA